MTPDQIVFAKIATLLGEARMLDCSGARPEQTRAAKEKLFQAEELALAGVWQEEASDAA